MDKNTLPILRQDAARTISSLLLKKARTFLHDDTRGAVAVMTALILPVLVGAAGLAVDASLWIGNKSMAQGASDNAARALLNAVNAGASTSQAAQIAYDVAAANGYKTGVSGVTVAITGPTSGVYLVQISQRQSLFFSSMDVSAAPTVRAQTSVQTPYTTTPPCILALDPHADSGTLSVQGTPTVSTNSCSIDNNSTSATGTTVGGAGSLTTTGQFKSPGGYSGNVTAAQYLTGSSAYATTDPFASLPTPTAGTCNTYTGTLTPGLTYCGNVTIHQGVVLAKGTYIFSAGSIVLNGSGSVDGTAGVTLIFINGATISINGASPLNLVAPKTGTYQGVAIFDATNRASPSGSFGTINGTSTVTINGAVYAPGQSLTYSGTNTATCTKLIAYQVSFSGTSAFTNDATCSDAPNGGNGGSATASGLY